MLMLVLAGDVCLFQIYYLLKNLVFMDSKSVANPVIKSFFA